MRSDTSENVESMLDLLIHNATLPDGRTNMSVAVQDGRIARSDRGLMPPAAQRGRCDAAMLLSTPFVDAHFHMDATLSLGLPRLNPAAPCSKALRCGANSNHT